ncbi:MAG: OmpH family outer membrane protein [Planctomycetes bacterium]|nr:OmpH family outer membrane protein [Planctomycetota bacterium]
MSGRTVTMSILVCAAAVLAAMPYGQAASQAPGPASRIGVVSVRDVFNGSKKHAQYQGLLAQRVSKARAQIEELNKQVETAEAELKVLKQGTADYVKQYQAVLEVRSKLQNEQEVLKAQRMAEDKKWFEDLYQEALKAIDALAKEKGLDLVLERSEPKFPLASEEVWSTVGTHKVLYSGGCVNLTNDVIDRIDASATLKP